jgi:hypothetical protein
MAKLGINTGIVPDDGLGDSLLDGAVKINGNFDEIYTYFGDGTNLTFTTFSGDYGDLSNTPVNLSDFSNDVGFITSFIDTDTNYWTQTSAGIHTLSNVGIGTTNPTENLTVFGDARVTGILTIGTASITLDGSSNTITVGSGVTIDGSTGIIEATSLVIEGTTFTGAAVTSITAGTGISVDQSTGNVTISAFGGGGGEESYWVETSAGIHTLSNVGIGTTNPQTSLEVVSGSYRFGFVGVSSDTSPFPGSAIGAIYIQNVDNIFDNSGISHLGDDGGLLLTNYRATFSNDDGLYRFGPVTNLVWDIYPAYLNQTFDAFYVGDNVFLASVDDRAYISAPEGIIFGGYGNVGIGTTTPESKLTIIGDAFISGVVTATSFIGNASSATYADSAGISTNVSGGTASVTSLSVSGISTLGTVQVSSGIVTSTSGTVIYYGDTSNTTDGRWILGASGTSDYTFTGIGFTQTTNDPILYLARGRVYEFVNNSGGSHPFQIRVSNGGSAYNDGVTNNGAASGVIRFEIPFNAPNTLYYQCTVHSGMGNTISVYPSTI